MIEDCRRRTKRSSYVEPFEKKMNSIDNKEKYLESRQASASCNLGIISATIARIVSSLSRKYVMLNDE